MIELFAEWYIFETPIAIKKIWGNYLWFFARYFALGELLRGFFAPWKGLTFSREKRAFDFGDAFSAAFGNFISRFLGAIIRLFFIIIGFFCELLVCVGALAAYILWIALIPLIFYSFKKGIYFLAIS